MTRTIEVPVNASSAERAIKVLRKVLSAEGRAVLAGLVVKAQASLDWFPKS